MFLKESVGTDCKIAVRFFSFPKNLINMTIINFSHLYETLEKLEKIGVFSNFQQMQDSISCISSGFQKTWA